MGDKITIECHRLSKTQREMVTRTKPNKNDLMSRTMVVLVRYKSLCIYRSLLNSAQQYEVRRIIFRIFIWTYWLSSGVTYSACASSETNRQRTEKTWSRIAQFEGKILIQHFPGVVLEVVVVIALSSLFAGITTIKYVMYKDFHYLLLWSIEQIVFFVIQIETEYGKGAWSGDIYRDVVAFPGDGKLRAVYFVIMKQIISFVVRFICRAGSVWVKRTDIQSMIIKSTFSGPRTTAEFAVISHEKDFFLSKSLMKLFECYPSKPW